MQEFLTFIGGLPPDRVLVTLAAMLGTIILAVAEPCALIFFPGPEFDDEEQP